MHRHVEFKDRVCTVFLTVHRQRRTQTMIPFPLKHPSLRAPCCKSSADLRPRIKRRPTPSILCTVSTNLSAFSLDPVYDCMFVKLIFPMLLFLIKKKKKASRVLSLRVSSGDRPRKLYAERALNLPLGAELITGNMWYMLKSFHAPLQLLFIICFAFSK